MLVKFGPYRLRRQERRVEGPDGPVELSARAFDLLCVLPDHAGEVVSKDTVFERIAARYRVRDVLAAALSLVWINHPPASMRR